MVKTVGAQNLRMSHLKKNRMVIAIPITQYNVIVPPIVIQNSDGQNTIDILDTIQVEDTGSEPPVVANEQMNDMSLRKSQRERRSVISDDYYVYLQEHESDIGIDNDPENLSQARNSDKFPLWMEVMNDELKYMEYNEVWDLVKLPKGAKTISCKWIFKTKWDSKGNIERYKAKLVAKGFTQEKCLDYNETFSPTSKKESLRLILAMVAHVWFRASSNGC